jgi:hypothetical protein
MPGDMPRRLIKSLPKVFLVNDWSSHLPSYFTRLILGITFASKTFTVISTFLIVPAYHLGVETNQLTNLVGNAMGLTAYMLTSAILVCLGAYMLYKRGPREIAFPFIFGLFLLTLFDATVDASTSIKLIFGF